MNEFPGLVDSHFHSLSLASKGLDPAACLAEFFDAGGRWALDVAVHPRDSARWAAGPRDPRVFRSAGWHPGDLEDQSPELWDDLERQISDSACVAVGEIGLDWHWGRDHEAAQRTAFRRQLNWAQKHRKPIIIHNREADRELLEDLDAENWAAPGIMHCFSSDLAFARAALDRGFLLSFAGNLTYKSASGLREVAAWAPLDRLLVETDAPYLAPVPFRGQACRPVHAGTTAAALAEVRGVSTGVILEATGRNFARLLGLDY